VINRREGPQEYPPDMPVGLTKESNFEWTSHETARLPLLAKAAISTANIITSGVESSVSVAFQRTVTNYWHFDALHTYTIPLTKTYIEDSLESPDVDKYIDEHSVLGSWSLFMITGVKVGHGALNKTSKSRELGVTVSPRV
jgi:hypothetical protein